MANEGDVLEVLKRVSESKLFCLKLKLARKDVFAVLSFQR